MAPVGGTMCAASPARKSRPYCIGSTTKLRMPGDALLEDRALLERPAVDAEARLQLVPDPLVRPLVDVLVGLALDVEAAEARRAQAEQREAALVVRVDELVARRRDLGEDAEPAERVVARERVEHAVRDARRGRRRGSRRSRRSRRTRARAARRRGEKRIRGRSVSSSCDADVVDLEEQRQPALEPRGDQVLDDLGLAVDDDRPAAGELAERDPVPLAVELELDPVVDDPLAGAGGSPTPGLGRGARRCAARARPRGSRCST